jgi:hypothetical protein
MGGPASIFFILVGVREARYWGFKSHAEWDEKTTQAGANQEKFCFD